MRLAVLWCVRTHVHYIKMLATAFENMSTLGTNGITHAYPKVWRRIFHPVPLVYDLHNHDIP